MTQGDSCRPTCRGRLLRSGGHGELACGRITIHVQQRTGSRLRLLLIYVRKTFFVVFAQFPSTGNFLFSLCGHTSWGGISGKNHGSQHAGTQTEGIRGGNRPAVRPGSAGIPGSIRLQGFLGFRPGDLCGTSTYTHVVGGWRTTTCCSTGRAHVFPEAPLGTCVHSGGSGRL